MRYPLNKHVGSPKTIPYGDFSGLIGAVDITGIRSLKMGKEAEGFWRACSYIHVARKISQKKKKGEKKRASPNEKNKKTQ